MCCANGGAFIKVGQTIVSLEYLLPMEYVTTMKVLLDKAPESKLEDLYRVIEEDLGQKVSQKVTSLSRLGIEYTLEHFIYTLWQIYLSQIQGNQYNNLCMTINVCV